MNTWFGFGPPFVSGLGSVLPRQVDERLIKNDILQLILTSPGERIYRPNFGTELKSAVFESMNELSLAQLSRSIELQITTYENRVKNVSVNSVFDEASASVYITINATYTWAPQTSLLIELSIDQTNSLRIVK